MPRPWLSHELYVYMAYPLLDTPLWPPVLTLECHSGHAWQYGYLAKSGTNLSLSLLSSSERSLLLPPLHFHLLFSHEASHCCYFQITIKMLLFVLAHSLPFSFYYENQIFTYKFNYCIKFHWSKFWFMLKTNLISNYKNLLPEMWMVSNKVYFSTPEKFLTSKWKSVILTGGLALCSLFIQHN